MSKNYSTSKALNPIVQADLLALAHEALDQGEDHFGIRDAIEQIRANRKIPINNNSQASYVRDLIAACPAIGDLIERRTGTKRGKNKKPAAVIPAESAEAVLGRLLKLGAKIERFACRLPDGRHIAIDVSSGGAE